MEAFEVLREAGPVTVRQDGTRRFYALRAGPRRGRRPRRRRRPGADRALSLAAAEHGLADLQGFWSQRLDALEAELARHRRTAARARTQDHGPPENEPDGAAPAAHRPRRMA
ncbi:MAG TPA: hypothetical protein VK875_02415 [Euzebyales bacterium]|nr:hypothetical protein [Euzebyales bacterium]